MSKDYYQILGVSKDAPESEIRRAFHKLAHEHHPDKGGDEKKFKEINEAYQILSNKDKRNQYDQFGRTFEAGGQQPGWDFGFGPFGGSAQGQGWDFTDLGDIFEEMFGFGENVRQTRKDIKRGKDIEVEMAISLEDTLNGGNKEISLDKEVTCSRCQGKGAEPGTQVNECFSCRGTGQVQQIKRTVFGSITRTTVCPECGGEGQKPKNPCNVCRGEGRVKAEERIRLFIPAGVDTNQIIKIEGKGQAGRRGGRPGDLYVRIFVKKHPLFKRKGDDLYLAHEIPFTWATLGGEVEVPQLGGKSVLLKVPAGTESGKVFRLSGKGIPHFQGYGRGSLYVELVINTPKHLTKKQKELLETLKKEGI